MRTRWILAILYLGGACALLGAIGLAWIVLDASRTTVPQVGFQTPRLGDVVDVGSTTVIHAVASDPDGVVRVELWIDGSLAALKTTSLAKGSTPLPLLADWSPATAGGHTLIVRAVDSQGNEGQASVIVGAAEGAVEAVYVVDDSAGPLPPEAIEAIAEDHPGLAEALGEGETGLSPSPGGELPHDDFPPPPVTESEDEPPEISSRIGGWMATLGGLTSGTFALPGEWLEIEALSLEVDKVYDGVYCYLLLGGTFTIERLPAEGFLQTPGGRSWDIAAELGGANHRTLPIPADRAPLLVHLQCLGFNETSTGGEVFELGSLQTEHVAADWDGRRLDTLVSGEGGWFRVAYRIIEGGGGGDEVPFPAPSGLSKRCFENQFLNVITCVLSWYYPEARLGEISGYLLVRDGTLYADLPLGLPAADARQVPLMEGGGVPGCGERFEYWVIAYQGDLIAGSRSAESNHLVLEGEVCETREILVTFETLNTVCLTGDCIDNPFELDTEGRYLPPEGPLDPIGCDRGRGCEGGDSYARLHANEHTILLGGMNDLGITYGWECGGIYPITGMLTFGEANPVELTLAPYESLEIAMRLYDFDPHTGDDLQCSGGYSFSPDDLRAIGRQPGRRQTFTRVFNEAGGGGCYLVFTIEAPRSISLPEHEGYEPVGPGP